MEEDCSIYQCSYSSVEELFIDDRAHSAFKSDEKLWNEAKFSLEMSICLILLHVSVPLS